MYVARALRRIIRGRVPTAANRLLVNTKSHFHMTFRQSTGFPAKTVLLIWTSYGTSNLSTIRSYMSYPVKSCCFLTLSLLNDIRRGERLRNPVRATKSILWCADSAPQVLCTGSFWTVHKIYMGASLQICGATISGAVNIYLYSTTRE